MIATVSFGERSSGVYAAALVLGLPCMDAAWCVTGALGRLESTQT